MHFEKLPQKEFIYRVKQISSSASQSSFIKNFRNLKKDFQTQSTEKTVQITKILFRLHADAFSLEEVQTLQEAIESIESNMQVLIDEDLTVFHKLFQAIFPQIKKKIVEKVKSDLDDARTFIEMQRKNIVDAEFNRHLQEKTLPTLVLHLLSFFPREVSDSKKEQIVEALFQYQEKQKRRYIQGIATSLGIHLSKNFQKKVESHVALLKNRRAQHEAKLVRAILTNRKLAKAIEEDLRRSLSFPDACGKLSSLCEGLKRCAKELHFSSQHFGDLMPILHAMVIVAGRNPKDGYILKLATIEKSDISEKREGESLEAKDERVELHHQLVSLIKAINS